jgi:hypothetical protein
VSNTSTTCADTTNSVTVAAGDKLDIEASPSGTPTAGHVHYTTKYVSNTATHSSLMGGHGALGSTTTYISLHGDDSAGTEFAQETVFPTSGTLKNLYVQVLTAPGTGNSRTFTVRKNSVSTALACTISGTETRCSDLVNTVTIAAGDTGALQMTVSGTPTSSNVLNGVVFAAATAGDFITAMSSREATNTAATNYYFVSAANSTQHATEGERDQLGQAMTLKAIYAEMDVAPDNGPGVDSYQFTLRKNGADTALSCTISDTNTTCNASVDVTIAAGDLLALELTPSNAPAQSAAFHVSFLGNTLPPAKFPTVVGTSSSETACDCAPTITLPAGIQSGDLIIAFLAKDSFTGGTATATWPSPWVELVDQTAGTAATLHVAYLIASGGETTVLPTMSVNERSKHLAIRIAAGSWHGTTPPEVATAVAGVSANPNSGSLTPSWGSGRTLWITTFGIDAPEGTFPVTGWPTNYADNNLSNGPVPPGATSAAGVALATRNLAAATEDPGAFTTTGSDDWVASTVAVRPADASTFTITDTIAKVMSADSAATVTSTSFNVNADDLILIFVNSDTTGDIDQTVTLSDNQTPDLAWALIADRDAAEGTALGGYVGAWWAQPSSAITGLTVTATRTITETVFAIKPYVVTGHDTKMPIGAKWEGESTTNNWSPTTYSSTVNNSRAFGAATDYTDQGLPASTDIADAGKGPGAPLSNLSWLTLYKDSDTTPSGTAVTVNFDAAGALAPDWTAIAFEVRRRTGTNYRHVGPVANFAWSSTWTAVTGCSLTLTPGSTSENWVVIATGQVRSSSTADPQAAHVRMRVQSTVEAEAGVQNNPANGAAGFFMMDRITGTTASQTIDVQAQDPFADGSTTTVEQCSITAFRVPSGADFRWSEVNNDTASANCPDTPNTDILQHQFTPSAAGDYLFITSHVAYEFPGGVNILSWVIYPSGARAPLFDTQDAWGSTRDARQSYVSMRKETLAASQQTLKITCDGSTGGSTIQWAKVASFRTDAFAASYHDEDVAELTGVVSSAWATRSTVTQAAPAASSEFLVLGTISGCDVSATPGPQAGMRFREDSAIQGDSVWGIDATCNNSGFHNTFQWVEPYTTASARTWDNQYQSTDNATEARFAESAIHVLRFFPSECYG